MKDFYNRPADHVNELTNYGDSDSENEGRVNGIFQQVSPNLLSESEENLLLQIKKASNGIT